MKQPPAPIWLPDILHPGIKKPSPRAIEWAHIYEQARDALTAAMRDEFTAWSKEWSMLSPCNIYRTRIAYEAARNWAGSKIPWEQLSEVDQRVYLGWAEEVAAFTYVHGASPQLLGIGRSHGEGPSAVFVFTLAGMSWEPLPQGLRDELFAADDVTRAS